MNEYEGFISDEDIKQFNNIKSRYDRLQESNIEGAYALMKDAHRVAERWSFIKYKIRKELGRGQAAAFKDRLDEMYRYLKEVATTSRIIWKMAKEEYRNIRNE